jgi:tetratricopeptide (TPR) repeat protein
VLSIAKQPRSNTDSAIVAFREALGIYTRSDYPRDYALTHFWLGQTYLLRAKQTGTEMQNVENAIGAHMEALSNISRQDDPLLYANVRNGLGFALEARGALTGRQEDLVAAAQAYKEAQEILAGEGYSLNTLELTLASRPNRRF